jgi:hypothetical protein
LQNLRFAAVAAFKNLYGRKKGDRGSVRTAGVAILARTKLNQQSRNLCPLNLLRRKS